jgi:hypothetical protein
MLCSKGVHTWRCCGHAKVLERHVGRVVLLSNGRGNRTLQLVMRGLAGSESSHLVSSTSADVTARVSSHDH